jgi:hypothetical protein
MTNTITKKAFSSGDSRILSRPNDKPVIKEFPNNHEPSIQEQSRRNIITRNSNRSFHSPEEQLRIGIWENFRKYFQDEKNKKFNFFRQYFTLSLNTIGIIMNFAAVISGNSSIVSKKLSENLDKSSEWFSKYVIPLSFGWNGIEAAVGNRGLEALSRFIPAVSFIFLPFYNLNIATGLSSGLQYLFELVRDRHGGKPPSSHDIKENAKETLKTSIAVIKDIITGNRTHEDLSKQIGAGFLLLGGLGGLIFASRERDSSFARFFGNMRNIGGLVADWKLIFNDVKNNARRAFDLRFVGSLCSTASILNIIMRWVNPEELSRSLTHIAIAIDDFGLTYWAQCSKRDNDEQFNRSQETN